MDILKFGKLVGLDPEDILKSVVHYATPKLSKAAFAAALDRASDEACAKIGRLLSMAGAKLQKLDRKGAAGDLGRAIGEIKVF